MIAINLGTTRKPDHWLISPDTLTDEDLKGRRTIARRLKIANLPHNTKCRWWPTTSMNTPKAIVLLALDKAKMGYALPWARGK